MPTRFWSARRPGPAPVWVVQRPPANDVWVLYQNMMHVWRWMFVPPCVLIGAGLLALGAAAFSRRPAPALVAVIGVLVATAAGHGQTVLVSAPTIDVDRLSMASGWV